jgi:hypothetical protein
MTVRDFYTELGVELPGRPGPWLTFDASPPVTITTARRRAE